MNIVIAGGGKIGYYLAKTLIPNKHKVTIIESKMDMCEKIANELNIPVIFGDATDIEFLSEADVGSAHTFIAVTGRDEDNLIACQLAKNNFNVKRTIARVNNPKNITVFEKLGVDIPVSGTSIIADLIEQEVDFAGMKTLMSIKNGKIVLSEIFIHAESPIINKSIKDINIPSDCILISVIRDEEVIIPNGYTTLQAGDYVIAVSSEEDQQNLRDYFIG